MIWIVAKDKKEYKSHICYMLEGIHADFDVVEKLFIYVDQEHGLQGLCREFVTVLLAPKHKEHPLWEDIEKDLKLFASKGKLIYSIIK